MRATRIPAILALAVSASLLTPAFAEESSTPKKTITDINELLTDSAAGHVSAASLLGISPSSVTAVENTRGFVAAVKGLGTPGNSVGFSVTPGRTSIVPMSLSTYDKGFLYRLLGNTGFSYAQGTAKISGTDMERRAVAVEANATFFPDDDPILVVKQNKAGPACQWDPGLVPPGSSPDFSEANKKYLDCIDGKVKKIEKKWNISRFSLSYGTGDIKPEGGTSNRLGSTVAMGIVYGFDGFMDALSNGAAAAFTLRRTTNEPILVSLTTASVERKSSNLAALRISGGSSTFRGLAEVSNASAGEVAVSQRIFRYAAGFDYRISEGMWMGFRIGKQRKTSGGGEEVASLLDFSFSPKSLQ